MKFRPLHDRVVIRRIEGEDKTKGGIIIPDTAKKTAGGRGHCRGSRRPRRERQACSARSQGGRPGAVWEMVRHQVKIDGEDLLIMEEFRRHGRDRGRSATKKKAA